MCIPFSFSPASLTVSTPPQNAFSNQTPGTDDPPKALIEILSNPANGSEADVGFQDMRKRMEEMQKRIDELDKEKRDLFEENRRLLEQVTQWQVQAQSSQPDMARTMNMHNEIKSLRAIIQKVEAERNDAIKRHNNLVDFSRQLEAKQKHTEAITLPLMAHCRTCPEYRKQYEASKTARGLQMNGVPPNANNQMSSQQLQQVQILKQQHQRRASAPNPTTPQHQLLPNGVTPPQSHTHGMLPPGYPVQGASSAFQTNAISSGGHPLTSGIVHSSLDHPAASGLQGHSTTRQSPHSSPHLGKPVIFNE